MASEKDGTQKMIPPVSRKPRKIETRPLCSCTSYSCNKLFVFIYAIIFLIIGAILTILGVYGEIVRKQYTSLNDYLRIPVILLLTVGLVIFLNALCGVFGAVKENRLLLKVFLVFTVVAFILQVTIGIIAYVNREEVPDIMNKHLMFAVEKYSENGKLAKAMDILQSDLKCCGIESYQDYDKDSRFRCGAVTDEACGVPHSCCRETEDDKVLQRCGWGVRWNVTTPIEERIYKEGCTQAFKDWLAHHLDLVGAISLGTAIPQIIGILLTYFLIRQVKEYQVWYRVNDGY